jgi:hypothetical protein
MLVPGFANTKTKGGNEMATVKKAAPKKAVKKVAKKAAPKKQLLPERFSG